MVMSSASTTFGLMGQQAAYRTVDEQYLYCSAQSHEYGGALGASNAARSRQGGREALARIAWLRDDGGEPRSAARTKLVLEDEGGDESGSCCAQTDAFASRHAGPVDDACASRGQGGGQGKAQSYASTYPRAATAAACTALADVICRSRLRCWLCDRFWVA